MKSNRPVYIVIVLTAFFMVQSGCLRYSFTGVSIPANVSTIYIPFFQDNSSSGLGDLSDQLNAALVNRFVNQTRLRLVTSADQGDILMEGTITGYSNRPFSVAGDQTASLNRVQITVRASYQYADEDRPRWAKSFSGQAEYDPAENPLDGELGAAAEAMQQVAQNMFNDSVGRW
ncbi:MAG: LPS assembly lipoprotein LptE [Balneolales bacterium]|nr:LPS assembly lipoprotein LptE [Balneolales bacterium]